ncbi:MAG: TAT-variant-translocated molybdopterin oxidoreductase [Phycisphaerales bacterium]|nr:TAT-variant-translocated molybdopterin oxidoreductase [Phycisphaerales bacterium]
MIDQCPSTTKAEKRKPSKAELADTPRELQSLNGRAGGPKVWRSVEEFSDQPQFREFVEREFPAGASELLTGSRRDFVKLMGASLALAGAATIPGCRRPDHKIMSYSQQVPEEIIPGKPLFYATSMPLPGGGAEGLLVETHEGRPTKVEGNPLHPINRGRSSIWAQASILSLYDPDRPSNVEYPKYRNPSRGPLTATWDDFRLWADEHFKVYDSNEGDGLAFIVDKKTSPSRDAARDLVKKRWPKASWLAYNAAETSSVTAGAAMAFGSPMHAIESFDKADVVVSLDRDFLNAIGHGESLGLSNARSFASRRRPMSVKDSMNRLYVAESGFTMTGASADHRLRLAPSRIAGFAVELAKVLLNTVGGDATALASAVRGVDVPAGADIDPDFVNACADDLRAAAGRSIIVAGPSLAPAVHALVHAMNAALGNIGKTVSLVPMSGELASDSLAGLGELSKKMMSGGVKTLVTIGVNPLYDAPVDADFAAAFAKVANTITLSVELTETLAASTWALNGAHALESWGDTMAADGTIAPIQPMIAPLYEPAMSELELLTVLASDDRVAAKADGYEFVRGVWKSTLGEANFDKKWREALWNGVVINSGAAPASPKVDYAAVASVVGGMKGMFAGAPSQTSMEAVFVTGHVGDGRFANIPWLQELPVFGTRTVWDNPALVSPQTAEAMGLMPDKGTEQYPEARLASVTIGGRSVTVPVWILPGMADNVVVLTLGYGRKTAGRVADGVGVDVNPLRTIGGGWSARDVKLVKEPGGYPISSTQNHWSLEGRTAIARAVDLPVWQKYGEEIEKKTEPLYGTTAELKFAERLGELSHTPPNIGAYENPYNRSKTEPDPKNVDAAGKPPVYATGEQWGMTIDLSSCTGCGTCTIACQAENNIPVVGKKEVQKGREMTWIRVDRYYVGNDLNDPGEMLNQPVACVHCENAPCEVVCPVNATVHGPEGINYMTYNRCIGTRYCANNCPYKVRRFNFFDYGVTKFNGDYFGKETLEKIVPDRGGITGSGTHNKLNPNLIPPRLRQKLDEISRMQKNPDVTVRSRGVMEKCSFCIQRINAAKVESKLKDLKGVPEGMFQVACQQACPSEAITFGNILDPAAAVHATRNSARSYMLLGYLNTRPRTTHMVRVRNPNEKLLAKKDPERVHSWEHPFHHGHESHDSHDTHDTGGAAKEHAFRVEPSKRRQDRGYALSLNVLSSGVNA